MDATPNIGLICAGWFLLNAASLPAQSPARIDAMGDPLPVHAIGRLGSDRFVTRERVESLAFNFDGSLLAAADYLDAYLWDGKTGKRLLQIRDGGGRVAISPDGRWLACGHNAPFIIPRPVRIWNVKSNRAVDLPIPKDAGGFGFSPDGKTLAIAFRQKTDVHLYDVGTWKLRQKLGEGAAAEQCHDVAFSPDGQLLAVAHTAKRQTVEQENKWMKPTGTIVLWDLEKKAMKREFRASRADAKCLAFTLKGKTLFAMSEWEAQGWDIETGEPSPWRGEAWRSPVAIDNEGKVLAVSRRLMVLDFDSKELVHAFGDEHSFTAVMALSGNGKRFAAVPVARSPSPVIHVWDVDKRKRAARQPGHSGSIHAIGFSPDGKQLATASNDDGTFCLWDAASASFKSITAFRDLNDKTGHGTWAGRDLRLAERDLFIGGQFWDIANKKPQRREPPASDFTRELAAKATGGMVSANGEWAVSFVPGPPAAGNTSRTGYVFWNVAQHKPALRMETAIKAKGDRVEEFLSFWSFANRSPWACINRGYSNGPIDIIKQKQRLEIWDLGAEKRLIAMARGDENLRAVAFSPDDSLLAVFAHYPPRLEMVHLGFQRKLWRITWEEGNLNHTQREIAFAPHGQWIVAMSSERSLELLETWTGEKIVEYEGHQRPTTALAFSPTGRHFATGSDDATALIWSAMPPATPLPERWKDDEHLWQGLAGTTETAYRIVGPLIGDPERAIQLFERRLAPAQPIDTKAIQRDLKGLGSASFAERESAMKRLRALGRHAMPALQEALKEPSSLEVKRRLEGLSETVVLRPAPDELRGLRAVLVLELVNTPRAVPLLRRLTRGDPDAELTRQARAALERLGKTIER